MIFRRKIGFAFSTGTILSWSRLDGLPHYYKSQYANLISAWLGQTWRSSLPKYSTREFASCWQMQKQLLRLLCDTESNLLLCESNYVIFSLEKSHYPLISTRFSCCFAFFLPFSYIFLSRVPILWTVDRYNYSVSITRRYLTRATCNSVIYSCAGWIKSN